MRRRNDLRSLNATSCVIKAALLTSLGAVSGVAAAPATSPQSDAVQIKASLAPSPRLQTSDGSYSVRLAGFFQLDHVENEADGAAFEDGSKVRRARFGVRGTVAQYWHYDYMLEAGSSETQLFDANIAYTGFKKAAVKVGQFKEPIGLEWSTGAPWWTFMDRALIASITPKRSIGVAVSTGGKKWRAHIGHFTDNTKIAKSAEEDGATTARLTFAPLAQKGRVVHIGVSGSVRNPDPVSQSVRFKGKQETAMTTKPVLDTGNITNVEKTEVLGVEGLGIWGPLSLQGEYAQLAVDRNGNDNLDFSSFYVQGAWFITGEKRSYKVKKGGFARVKPKKTDGIGALEVAVRYDQLDLTDKDISGGTLDRVTAGINWYPNTNIRISTNYIEAEADEHSVTGDQTLRSLLLRTQFAF